MWLVSFGIKLVRVRRANGSSKLYREPSHEYTVIKEMMYSRLYGPIYMSTYICLKDESFRVKGYLDLVTPLNHTMPGRTMVKHGIFLGWLLRGCRGACW